MRMDVACETCTGHSLCIHCPVFIMLFCFIILLLCYFVFSSICTTTSIIMIGKKNITCCFFLLLVLFQLCNNTKTINIALYYIHTYVSCKFEVTFTALQFIFLVQVCHWSWCFVYNCSFFRNIWLVWLIQNMLNLMMNIGACCLRKLYKGRYRFWL